MGKESMPKPSKATYSIARQATAGVPLAKPVKVKYDSPLTKALKIFLDE
jgi:hypothetical protein